MFEEYMASIWAFWAIFATIFIQALVAVIAHRKQAKYTPGVLDESLGHESFVFRSDRTFRNSLENIIPLAGMGFLGMMVGVNTVVLASILWVYAIARLIHMALYYKIATERNPSPRSYFYMIGLLANLVLIFVVAATML